MTRKERLMKDKAIDPVLFYLPRDDNGCFSNFSDHPIALPNPWTFETDVYLSGEVRFQAMKGVNRKDYDFVMQSHAGGDTVSQISAEAKARGRIITLREDWGNNVNTICWYVMLEVLMAKALQHEDVRETLIGTAERVIYEDSPTDDIWGWRHGQEHRGKNLLGFGWMQTRAMLC